MGWEHRRGGTLRLSSLRFLYTLLSFYLEANHTRLTRFIATPNLYTGS